MGIACSEKGHGTDSVPETISSQLRVDNNDVNIISQVPVINSENWNNSLPRNEDEFTPTLSNLQKKKQKHREKKAIEKLNVSAMIPDLPS